MVDRLPVSPSRAAAAASDSAIRTWFDDAQGIIRVVGTGHWTVTLVRSHFDELARLIEDMRRKTGRALVLVDLCRAAVQDDPVAAEVAAGIDRVYAPQDRVAVIVPSPLVKAQMLRTGRVRKAEVFLSGHAAQAWLKSLSHGSVPRRGQE